MTQTDPDQAIFRCNFTSELQKYRWTYKLYHMDPDFRLARANHPFIVQLDNHDLTGRVSDRNEGSRRAALEWVPQRVQFEGDRAVMPRSFRYGANNLLDIIVMDTYTYELDPKRNGLLGEGQHQWLNTVLTDSKARGVQWRILASGKPFMPQFVSSSRSFIINDPDEWQGQPKSLLRVLDQLETTQTDSNNVWLSGDLHECFVADVVRFNPYALDLLLYRKWLPNKVVKRYGAKSTLFRGSRQHERGTRRVIFPSETK
jgi:phosphodiesterase/alkaline phosphatase D-like protein